MPTKKLRATAQTHVPQSKDECAADLHDIGTLQRTRDTLVAQMNQQIADITLSYQPQLQLLQTQIDGKFKGVQAWCEAHRAEITDNLRVKTANLLTGEVVWRVDTPSCSVKGEDLVVQALKAANLGAYVRTKESVNKEAVIAVTLAARAIPQAEAVKDPVKSKTCVDAAALASIPGLKVVSGVEAFSVTPFEQEATA